MPKRISGRGLWRNQRGNSLIELALSLPLMLLMCCGAMDFARVVYSGITTQDAAGAGAEFGAVTPGNSGNITGMVQAAKAAASDLGGNLTASASNFCSCDGGVNEVSCTTTCSGATPDGYVSVTANYTFNTLVSWPGVPHTMVLARTAKIRVQ